MENLRLLITINLCKIIQQGIKLLMKGNGYTWPGHIALKVYPNILTNKHLKFNLGVIVVSGTNGKTTTTKLLSHLFAANSYKVCTNTTGANLINGVVSHIIAQTNIMGHSTSDVAIFEVDEAALSKVVSHLSPKSIVLLNLSRDQLDRHWEVDLLANGWSKMLQNLPTATHVFYANLPCFDFIPSTQNPNLTLHSFDNSTAFISHTNLLRGFNNFNVNAAVQVCSYFGIPDDVLRNALTSFAPGFGRGEGFVFSDKHYTIFLAKNPASMNENLKALLSGETVYDSLLFILNDNIPDGLDISWIYDIQPELLAQVCATKDVFVAGTRCFAMAARLKYAHPDIKLKTVTKDYRELFDLLSRDSNLKNVVVLPNYSAMLEFRKYTLGRNIL